MKLNAKTGVAAACGAGLLGLGLYIAVPAAAANPSPSPSSSSTSSPHDKGGKGDKGNRGGHGWRHGLRGSARGLHGEMTVKRKDKFLQVAWQRGQVTGRSGN